jgi:hypothetical protein
MTAPIDSRQREISRLTREIAYYCDVIARTMSREWIQRADAVFRPRERQVRETHSADTRQGSRDDDE